MRWLDQCKGKALLSVAVVLASAWLTGKVVIQAKRKVVTTCTPEQIKIQEKAMVFIPTSHLKAVSFFLFVFVVTN